MRKRLITILAAVAVSMSLGMTAYALPAQAGPEDPALTIRDIPETQSPNPGPFPTRATLEDLEEFEAPQDTEDAENPGESWPPESDAEEPEEPEEPGESGDTEAPSEPEDPGESSEPGESGEPEEPSEPESPVGPDTPADPENPGDPNAPANPTDPSTPNNPETPAEDGTISADVAAIRESLGVLIETNQPFFADETEKQYFFDNLAAIRKDLDMLLYVVIPVAAAVLALYKIFIWFYRTFVESALG